MESQTDLTAFSDMPLELLPVYMIFDKPLDEQDAKKLAADCVNLHPIAQRAMQVDTAYIYEKVLDRIRLIGFKTPDFQGGIDWADSL